MLSGRDKDLAQETEISSAGIVTKEKALWAKSQGHPLRKPFFGLPPFPCVIYYLRRRGIDASGFRTRELNRAMVKQSDIIITMDEGIKSAILSLYPEAEG